MNLPFYIAKRYLISKKSQQAINIVSLVSVCGVAVGTMALVVVLSVFNGFNNIIEDLFSNFDPEIKISAKEGKVFNPESIDTLKTMPEIAIWSEVLQDNALLKFRDKQCPITLKGVDSNYNTVNNIDEIILQGNFKLKEGNFNLAVGGVGLARVIGCGVHYVEPLYIYAPKRQGKVSLARPDNSFTREIAFLTAVFMVKQDKYDNNLLLVPIDLTRNLFDYKTEVSAIEIKLLDGCNINKVKNKIKDIIGEDYKVEDRYEQQYDYFRMLKIEKWITYLILSFILLIAVFNIIGSLSMLMIEKKADIKTLTSLGAGKKLVFKIFLFEGWLISIIGVVVGIVLGLLLCFLQIKFGIIRLGANYIVPAYPVDIECLDIVLIFITVCVLGFVASFYPARQVYKNKF